MKVGGNQAFNDYLTKHGRGAVSTTSSAKEKYTSTAAGQYKDELKRRAKEDELRYGAGPVTTEGIADAAQPTDAGKGGSKSNGGNVDDDFFDSWDKPTNIIAPTPTPSPKPVLGGPPRIGLTPVGTPNGSRPTTPSLAPAASPTTTPAASSSPSYAASPTSTAPPAASRAVSSSSLRTTSAGGARAGAMKLGGGTKSKLGGVKKGGPAINFEEAERKAREEEERIKRLGYDREQEAKAAAEAAATAAAAKTASYNSTSNASRGEMVGNKKSAAEMERLGMGFGRLGFGQVAGMSGEQAAKAAADAKRAAQRAGMPEPGESPYLVI